MQLVHDEVDRVFGPGYVAAHSNVVSAALICTSLDWAAMNVAASIRDVADALVEEPPPPGNGLLRTASLLRPRP